jgi:hypothetical protein
VPVRKNAFVFNWAVGQQVARYRAMLTGNASQVDNAEPSVRAEVVGA